MTQDLGARPEQATQPRLSRSRRHKVIGGVCGGVGRSYDIDPVIFRVPLAVLSVIGGLGCVAYGLAWLLIPFEGEEENEGRRLLSGRVEGPGLTALLFILAGCGLLLASIGRDGAVPGFSIQVFAALAGVAYWSRRRAGRQAGEAEGAAADGAAERVVAEAPPEAQAPPAAAGPSWWRGTGEGGYLWGPEDARPGDYRRRAAGQGTLPAQAGWTPGVWAPREHLPAGEPEPREFRLGALVLLLAMLACVVGTALSWESQPLGTALVIGLGAALAVFGLGFLVSTFFGRLGAGTVLAVILTGGLLSGASLLPDNITTGWSEPVWQVTSAAELRPVYELGTGDAELDLTGLEVAPGRTVSTAVEAGAGQVTVLVPPDVTLKVDTEIDLGAFSYTPLPGGDRTGPDTSFGGIGQEERSVYEAEQGQEPGGTIELRLEMGIGNVEVHRAVEGSR
ncbi:PspC domain-containing protein [Streptomyces hoynatensis]|uniref:PspC domain-containing protein n=1 Tax=Streptomyces hoynatensis TaxID=1141874 RepID=A0A3A9ZF36_9ACTN|nr:PspC domain-containing protein [Streptomyces hoynatensis]RKN46829.1 PspC domain-containing protein [Streptomyces hoynatensis]